MNYCTNTIQNIEEKNLPIVVTGIACWEDILSFDKGKVLKLLNEALGFEEGFDLTIPLDLSIMSDFLSVGDGIKMKPFNKGLLSKEKDW